MDIKNRTRFPDVEFGHQIVRWVIVSVRSNLAIHLSDTPFAIW